jgi:hypothetical protein
MTESNSLTEIETRLKALDGAPRSLDILRQAIELAATTSSSPVNLGMDARVLRVQTNIASWKIELDEAGYHCFCSQAGDSSDNHEQSTSKLTWEIVGHPIQMQRIRESAAAAAKRFLAQKKL